MGKMVNFRSRYIRFFSAKCRSPPIDEKNIPVKIVIKFTRKFHFINTLNFFGGIPVPSNERAKEIKRRRHRKVKIAQYAARVEKGTLSKEDAVAKIRKLTIGSEEHIEHLGL